MEFSTALSQGIVWGTPLHPIPPENDSDGHGGCEIVAPPSLANALQ